MEKPPRSAGRASAPAGRSTIHDVARTARVSTATVSRVLSGTKPVSDDLAQRVRDAAAELGYRPNPAAQVLLRGRSQTIGVVVPDLANAYFAEVLKGATAAGAVRDFRTLVADSNEDVQEEFRAAMELARWVDGLLLCSPRMATPELKKIAAAVPALVVVNRLAQHPSVAAVVVDYYRGMTQVCDHLLALGHRCVVYLQGPPHAWSERQRRRALRAAADRGLEITQIPCGSGVPDGYRTADEAVGYRPTAIVAFNDNVALGLLSRLRELDVAVPAQVSVVGFDDIGVSAMTAPALTTVAVPKLLLGRLAWERFEAPPGGPATRVPADLVVRTSTAAVPRRSAR